MGTEQQKQQSGQSQKPQGKRTWRDWLRGKPKQAGLQARPGQQLARADGKNATKPGLQRLEPLQKVRTSEVRRGNENSAMSLLGLYLGGIAGGFTVADIPDMKRDPDVSLGLEYLLTPILNAKVTITGTGDEQVQAQAIFDRFWQHDLETFKDMFSYGYCPAEVRYKEAEQQDNSPQRALGSQNSQGSEGSESGAKLDYDGMIPLEPKDCEPWVHDGKLAYVKAYDKIKLEGNTDNRPAKGFWLANDPTYSPFIGNSVLPGSWLFWRAKVGMPDSAVEVLLKANYKCAFSGNKVLFPAEEISDEDGTIYDSRAEAEWYAENIKAGTNVALPSETDDKGKRKWDIESYGGQPIDIAKMLPLMDWLTKQIHRGMGVVDDVITKEGNTGGYSRSNVSRQMFLMLALRRARRIAHTFDQMVCRPLIKRNGMPGTYKVDVTIPGMEDEDPNGGGFGQQGQGDQQGSGEEEGGPLAKLFQQTMDGEGKDAPKPAKAPPQQKSEEESDQDSGPAGIDMSLSSFLSTWKSDNQSRHGEE